MNKLSFLDFCQQPALGNPTVKDAIEIYTEYEVLLSQDNFLNFIQQCKEQQFESLQFVSFARKYFTCSMNTGRIIFEQFIKE